MVLKLLGRPVGCGVEGRSQIAILGARYDNSRDFSQGLATGVSHFIAGRVSTEAAPTAVKSPLDGFMKVIATHASHSRATCTDDAGRTTEEPFFQAVRVRHKEIGTGQSEGWLLRSLCFSTRTPKSPRR